MSLTIRISILFLAVLLLTAPSLPVTFAAEVLRWESTSGGRFAELSVPSDGRTGFTTMPVGATGILFTNVLTVERGLTNQIFMSGSGVALGDMDNDGRVDIYFCGLDCTNRLYRNLGGWKFADVTPAALACPEGASTGAVFADDANGFATRHLKVDVLERPELMVKLLRRQDHLKQAVVCFLVHIETLGEAIDVNGNIFRGHQQSLREFFGRMQSRGSK